MGAYCTTSSQPSISPAHYMRQSRQPRRKSIMFRVTIALSATLVIIVLIGPMMISHFPSFRDRPDFWIRKEDKQQRASALKDSVSLGNNLSRDSLKTTDKTPNQSSNHSNVEKVGGHSKHHGSFTHGSNPIEVLLPSMGETISAAEKMQCPASVLSFVINATDVKDECEGLRKAFDKTCGGSASHEPNPTITGKDERNAGNSKMLMNRRKLSTVGSDVVLDAIESVRNMFPGGQWEKSNRRREMESSPENRVENTEDNNLQSQQQRQDQQQQHQEDQQQHQEEENEKHLSPTIPTSDEDVSENTIEGALLLNTDYLIVNNSTTEQDSIQGRQEEHFERQSNDENAVVNHTTHSKSNDIDSSSSSSMTTTTATAHVPETISIQTCCRSILKVFHDECDTPEEEEFNDKRLFVIVCVIALCGVVKSLIRHFKLRWLPEAGGCILVGMFGGLFLRFLPNMDFGFQHDMFLRLMVPPIVFEAALNINKRSFSQMSVPIVIFAVWGTFMSTIISAAFVYYTTRWITICTSIPFIESLAFGALISSIDPIAVLSVLSNMGMSDKDPIYVLIFGESLLNDGVAIVLFQTLVHFMDEKIVIDSEACWLATLHFLVIAFGSLFVGLACGLGATVYFWLMKGIQTPLVEVLMFLCWAFIPYYICDGVDWSGIVAIVAAGFFMDVYVIGTRREQDHGDPSTGMTNSPESSQSNMVISRKRSSGIFSQEGFLSAKAKNHIGFVTEINSTLMETAIFAYLGIFLLNKRYHWNFTIPLVAILSCIFSRSVMVAFSSALSNTITRVCHIGRRSIQDNCISSSHNSITHNHNESNNKNAGVMIDSRMQVVLIFAGLRGAMSFALVETVPMYDQSTGEGSRYKPELKAMTSACIVFTVFVLGGYTYYLLVKLGLGPMSKDEESFEMVSLINSPNGKNDEEEAPWAGGAGIQKRPSHSIHRVLSDHDDSSENSLKFI